MKMCHCVNYEKYSRLNVVKCRFCCALHKIDTFGTNGHEMPPVNSSSLAEPLCTEKIMDITLSHPQKCALKVPAGQILVNKRWRGSSVAKELDSSDCRTMFSDGLGFVDFFPADSFAVLYVTEAELLTPKTFTERTKLLAKDYKNRGVILVDVCQSSGYQELQELACLEYNLSVFPISNQNEIPRLLQALMHAEIRQTSNPFKNSAPEEGDMGRVQVSLLKQIPGIGEKSAMKLLSSYGSIKSISEICQERLETKVGKTDAVKVYNYFKNKVTL